MLNTLIVDDEPLAHEVILHYLKNHDDINVIAQCYDATQALSVLAKRPVDLLFLDINMPALSGIEMLKVLENKPQVIIISAYQEYALEGFELDVTDYLLKPVPLARFEKALNKVRQRTSHKPSLANESQSYFLTLKIGREKRRINLSDISHFEAYGNYVKVWQSGQAVLANTTLKRILEHLDHTSFTQIHKSYVVNRDFIEAVETLTATLTGGAKLKIGKSFKNMAKYLL